ncbi:MAG TPA: HEAT repeat domain-containing protein [Pyrinomonadaceae bacterium]|nr:HEAT repeat domain-containing protein [Pyrinomonadaceae bacterium]HMP65275.1 HEAT repeat domain-containing protein [Pyrinomonadaceae bacterium]
MGPATERPTCRIGMFANFEKLMAFPIRLIEGGCPRPAFLLFLLFSFSCSLLGQEVSFPRHFDDWPQIEARLSKAILNGTDEEKRDALFEIRNYRSATASVIALPALSDRNEIVRATAAASVVFLPASEAFRALARLLGDRRPFVRKEAAYALEKVGYPGSAPAIISALRRERDAEAAAALVIALGATGDRAAIEPLLGYLGARPSEETEFIRRSAARSIGRIAQIIRTGNATVTTPQNFLPEKFKDIGAGQEGLLANDPFFRLAFQVLESVLRDAHESDDTRREAAFALGAIGEKAAIDVLKKHQTSQDPYLVEIAREALLKLTSLD